ncbi:MAG TPA: SRPBCC family protein [Anaeromyxobacter sp.]|nr:SRPBCC family protein [Anaeromyxobacter sp.]
MTFPHPERDADPERDIVSARFLDAPRERVFEAFCDPAVLARWWGPKGFANTIHELDVRAGGHWRSILHAPDGRDFANHSVFVEVVRPERLVFRHVSVEHPYELTITLDERDGGSLMTWRMRHEIAEACARVRRFVVPANEENFDRLAAVLAGTR